MSTRQIRLPPDLEIVVVDSGRTRTVQGSAYAERVAECRDAAVVVGPLGVADERSIEHLDDPLLRRRARHVVTECGRVREVAAALEADACEEAGRLLGESHLSLSGDFEVSTPEMDQLVAQLASFDGVFGARMTGAGFGGCAVVLCRPGALDRADLPVNWWRVEAVDGTLEARAERRRRGLSPPEVDPAGG
jgi:galactokinase